MCDNSTNSCSENVDDSSTFNSTVFTPVIDGYEQIASAVYPSLINSVSVKIEDGKLSEHHFIVHPMSHYDTFNGTHYCLKPLDVNFVRKLPDGTWLDGFQDEQLISILLYRARNHRESPYNNDDDNKFVDMKIKALEEALLACKKRVINRETRDVFGKLKK